MSASAVYLVPKFNFQVGPSRSLDVSSESRRAESSEVSLDNAGRLVGAAGLYVFIVTSLLWSLPAWLVVFAPFVQVGVGRLMLWSLWR